ncbi:MAG TPA: sugar phosphate isomerase/epimerase [Armatimonadota bacterium]
MKTSGIAAQLYTLRDFLKTPADIATTMQRVKAIGYDAVQLSGLGPIEPQALATILREEGLTAAATHVSFARLCNDLPALIDEHLLWGCRNVAIGAMPDEYRNAAGYVRFAKEATEIGRKLADAGLTFSYHNHSFEFEKFDGKTGMELLYNNADPEFLLAEIDTYWVQHGGGDPAAWIEKLSGRMVIVHLKDLGIVDNTQVMAEIGVGNMNWARILPACRAAGVTWYAVEQDVCQRDPFESLTISLANLHAMDWA